MANGTLTPACATPCRKAGVFAIYRYRSIIQPSRNGRANGVSTIRLNRPAAFNALNQQLLQELFGAVLAVGSTPNAHAPVNTGKENFIADGVNIEAMQRMKV